MPAFSPKTGTELLLFLFFFSTLAQNNQGGPPAHILQPILPIHTSKVVLRTGVSYWDDLVSSWKDSRCGLKDSRNISCFAVVIRAFSMIRTQVVQGF